MPVQGDNGKGPMSCPLDLAYPSLEYNPDSLSRSYQIHGGGGEGGGERAQRFRLKGAAGETALAWREHAHATDETAQTVPSRAIRPDILVGHDNPNVIRG